MTLSRSFLQHSFCEYFCCGNFREFGFNQRGDCAQMRARAQKILCANARTRAIFQSECNVITSEYMFTRFYSFLFFKGFLPYYETVDMLQLARAVLYVPPTQTEAESAFSIQKWMLSGRRATMTPTNCNVRMVGRSCMRFKRRIEDVKKEMHVQKKRKLI